MKTTKRLMALLIALLVLAANVSVAMAADGDGSAYKPGKAGTVYHITEKLYMEDFDTRLHTGDQVTYTLAFAGGANPLPVPQDGSGTINPKMYSGAPEIMVGKLTFTNESTIHGTGVTDYSRYMQDDFVIDFSKVTFYEPGVYRYNLTKTKGVVTGAAGIKAGDVSNNRENDYILLYVGSDDNTATLKDVVYVSANSNDMVHATPIGKAFVDRMKAHHTDLAVTKTVVGNMGSKSQYFEFTIKLSGGPKTEVDKQGQPVEGASFPKYKVVGSYQAQTEETAFNDGVKYNNTLLGITSEEAEVDGETKTTNYITLNKDGEWEGQVWLRHNQGILFDHLPAGMKYTITEVPAGYTCDRENNKAEGRIPNLEGDDEETLVRERFTNTKTETPPTGINLQTTVPMLGILLASLLLAVVFCGKRRESR